MNANNWLAILFDLDDTLYPERDYVLSGFRAVARWAEESLHIPASEAFSELKHLFDVGVRGDTFNQWLHKRELNADSVKFLIRAYRDHVPVLKPFPGVRKLLTSLKRSYRLGLLSDGYLDVQKRKLAALGLEPLLEVVVFSDQWGREHWKPSPRPFKTAAELLKVQPSQMVYIADNPVKDFFGARELGIFTIRFQHDDGEYAKVHPAGEAYAPNVVVSSFDELHSLFKRTANAHGRA